MFVAICNTAIENYSIPCTLICFIPNYTFNNLRITILIEPYPYDYCKQFKVSYPLPLILTFWNVSVQLPSYNATHCLCRHSIRSNLCHLWRLIKMDQCVCCLCVSLTQESYFLPASMKLWQANMLVWKCGKTQTPHSSWQYSMYTYVSFSFLLSIIGP